jgi:predicted AAA+ superfamily ATPase
MYIPRLQGKIILNLLQPGKVVVIYGARRVGKTTLIRKLVDEWSAQNHKVLFVNGDDIFTRQYLESRSIQKLRDFVGNHDLLVVDEAQYVDGIGSNLKLIVDHMPDVRVIATGSSSFDLSEDIGEPLTGRKFVVHMHPFSQLEISQIEAPHETTANLESRLIYGSYPEVVTMRDDALRREYLHDMTGSTLFRDILALDGIRRSEKLLKLLQQLAFQIGKEVSVQELGTQLNMSKTTVSNYLDLLEKVFVIHRRGGFSRNLRKEITKNARYYFYDNGIRNAVIRQFNPLEIRDDQGALWENYIVCERLKRNECLGIRPSGYFWRTYDKKEIDLVEDLDGKLSGYEIKWKDPVKKIRGDWQTAYPGADFQVIHRENYLKFI